MHSLHQSLPVIIYISGAPGSGKTTLARMVSEELYIPHVSSDLVHGGISYSIKEQNNRAQTIHDAYVPLLVSMLKMNISFVVDHVLQQGLSEKDILDKIAPFATVLYVHLHAKNSIERHLDRELKRSDKGVQLSSDELADRAKYHRDNSLRTENQLEVSFTTITVDTTDGYNPSFENIIKFIDENRG